MGSEGKVESGAESNPVPIVDDSKQNIDILRGILEDDYTVYVATGGGAGLKVMKRVSPDIVLLDVMMPDMDGFAVLEQMKKDAATEKIPVIFISSETGAESEAKGIGLGAFDYIGKPYVPEVIKLKVKNQIANKKYRDNLEETVAAQTKELYAAHNAVIMGMSLLAESRDKGTGEHIQRMQKYTEILAWELHRLYPEKVTAEFAEKVVLYAPLHDIGKVSIPDAVLLKNGKLTDAEFEIIKSHTVFGGDVLRKTEGFISETNDSLKIAIDIAEGHHEKFNGRGYPHAKKGEEIPLAARIVALADIYDALTSKREYKDAFAHDKALDIILEGDGRTDPEHFDPMVLEAFKNVSEEFRNMTL